MNQNHKMSSGLIKYIPFFIIALLLSALIYQWFDVSGLKDDIEARNNALNELKQQLPELMIETDSTESMTIVFQDKYYIELSKIGELKKELDETIEDVNNTPDSVLLQWAVDRYRTNTD